MKVRNVSDLEDCLDRALGPRKRELTEQRFTVMRAEAFRAGVLRRSGVVFMYAHWEGFIREAGRLYVAFVDFRASPVKDLAKNFRAIALGPAIRRLGRARRVSGHMELLDIVESMMTSPQTDVRIRHQGVIVGRSSLDVEAFREILLGLGLEGTGFRLREKPLVERLVRLRHQIAHGARVPVDPATYNELHSGLIGILEDFRGAIVVAASDKKYLAPK